MTSRCAVSRGGSQATATRPRRSASATRREQRCVRRRGAAATASRLRSTRIGRTGWAEARRTGGGGGGRRRCPPRSAAPIDGGCRRSGRPTSGRPSTGAGAAEGDGTSGPSVTGPSWDAPERRSAAGASTGMRRWLGALARALVWAQSGADAEFLEHGLVGRDRGPVPRTDHADGLVARNLAAPRLPAPPLVGPGLVVVRLVGGRVQVGPQHLVAVHAQFLRDGPGVGGGRDGGQELLRLREGVGVVAVVGQRAQAVEHRAHGRPPDDARGHRPREQRQPRGGERRRQLGAGIGQQVLRHDSNTSTKVRQSRRRQLVCTTSSSKPSSSRGSSHRADAA